MPFKNCSLYSYYILEDDNGNEYHRHGADAWMKRYGESLELEYDTEELERNFQKFMGSFNLKG